MTTTLLDTHDMVLVHRVFRRELALLPQLVRSAPDPVRLRAHGEELLGFLHHHHSGEDDLVWPRLRTRVLLQQELVDRMEAQHERVAALSEQAELGFAAWGGDAGRGEALAQVLEQLHAAVVEHLDEEEREVLPLVAGCFTQAEWDELGERGLAAIAPRRRLVTLAHILEDADDAERAAFLTRVPAPVRLLYRLLGRRQHAKETGPLRIPLQRT
ncbi:MAG: hemerythrin cation-binding protein [Frankiales bacterium]|nr:hemerythrin cation-binding protein [Frankiales bacterium]